MWIISKSHHEKKFFFDIFAIHSSNRHEKRCQMSLRLFSLFRGSIYQQWVTLLGSYNQEKKNNLDSEIAKWPSYVFSILEVDRCHNVNEKKQERRDAAAFLQCTVAKWVSTIWQENFGVRIQFCPTMTQNWWFDYIHSTGGAPLTQKSLTRFPLPWFLAYRRVASSNARY